MEKVDILGVKVDDLSLNEATKRVAGWLIKPGQHYLVTPNLEFLLMAQEDARFRQILNQADLAIPDSSRLGSVKWLTGKPRLLRMILWPLFFFPFTRTLIQFNIVSGIDLMDRLCELAAEKGFTTAFLGGRDGVAKKAADCLQKKYPELKVVLADDGPEVDKQGNELGIMNHGKESSLSIIHNTYPISQMDILFVAFGQGKQEKWIANNLDQMPVKVAMGVGGSFDEISGKVPRIPRWVHQIGLKWLLRLILQPWRIKRQLALIKIVWLSVMSNWQYDKVKV